ncbi:MAG: hypothetical protein WD876_00315 [Candidatus Pacearchaeota archaeon]
MENKRKIATDIDEVLIDFGTPIREYYNKRFGTNLTHGDYRYYDLDRVWGTTKQRATEIVLDFYKTEEFTNMLPTLGAQEVIRKLSEKYELRAINSRPHELERDTLISLHRYFGNTFTEVFHNGQHGLHSFGLDKSGYCLQNGIFVILEDNLDIARKCAEKGIEVILFDKLWNESLPIPGITRVGINNNPWQDVLEILK